MRFKIFMGTANHPADEKANHWLCKHPNVEVIKMKYQMSRYSDHSICIMYKEVKDD